MVASELISNIVSPVRTSDVGEEVLTMMGVYHIRHLPIVNNEELLGVISEDDILSEDVDAAIGSYSLSMRRPFVDMHTNLLDMMRIMSEYNLSIIPVVDVNNKFKGMVLLEDLVKYFAKSATFSQPGGIIIIEINRQDYSLVEISRIIEAENAAVLGLFIYEHENPNSINLTIKINKLKLQHILAALHRYKYVVAASFSQEEIIDTMQDRYDSLMNYLNV